MRENTYADELVERDVAEVRAGVHVETEDTTGTLGREHDRLILAGSLQAVDSELKVYGLGWRGGHKARKQTYVDVLLVLEVDNQASDVRAHYLGNYISGSSAQPSCSHKTPRA